MLRKRRYGNVKIHKKTIGFIILTQQKERENWICSQERIKLFTEKNKKNQVHIPWKRFLK